MLPTESFPAQTSGESLLGLHIDRRTHRHTYRKQSERLGRLFLFSLTTTTRAINDSSFPPKQTRLCTGACQEVKKSPLGRHRQSLSTSRLLPPSIPGEAAWGPAVVKAPAGWLLFSWLFPESGGSQGEMGLRSLRGLTQALDLWGLTHPQFQ